jgi:phosphonate degradation associated HDIG domain protein
MHVRNFGTAASILDLLATHGGSSYFGEPVTVLEHSLQAAHFAQLAHSSNELIAAALLHDIGHLLHEEEEDVAEHGIDTHHEELADTLLSKYLSAAVVMPIRLHVAAKRYLCYANSQYLDALSPSSHLSLKLQGGPMTAEEAQAFLAGEYSQDAIALRHWDDEAKIEGLSVAPVESYLPILKQLWLAS